MDTEVEATVTTTPVDATVAVPTASNVSVDLIRRETGDESDLADVWSERLGGGFLLLCVLCMGAQIDEAGCIARRVVFWRVGSLARTFFVYLAPPPTQRPSFCHEYVWPIYALRVFIAREEENATERT